MTSAALRDTVGLDIDEILVAKSAAMRSLDSAKGRLARLIFESASPATCEAVRSALLAQWLNAFSEAGRASVVLMARDQPKDIATLDKVLHNFIADPVMFRDTAIWCLFFAALESASTFQLDQCPSPSEEGHLSGLLLAGLADHCEIWRQVVAQALARSGSCLTLQRIDLSILGGEQATGGDFVLVLDFDEGVVHRTDGQGGRIVPLIFQAKRYVRPNADVSQHHHLRGYQYRLLGQNDCASAYIFYENGTKRIERPVPPLVKPVWKVSGPGRTCVFMDSLDLPSYLFAALSDPTVAPGASSPDDALRMIYAKADPMQLAYLAVISSDSTAGARYRSALETPVEEQRGQRAKSAPEYEPK